MVTDFLCWKCGASIEALPRPLGRRAECPACHAELHVCRQCGHYDKGVSRACREPVAEFVSIKDRANFCDWFQARADAFRATGDEASQASAAALKDLFDMGDSPTSPADGDASRQALDELFGLDDGKDD